MQDHGAMAAHERGKRSFITFLGETAQQLSISELLDLLRREEFADVLQKSIGALGGHDTDPLRTTSCVSLSIKACETAKWRNYFGKIAGFAGTKAIDSTELHLLVAGGYLSFSRALK
jgi:hypothetical protein